MDKVLVIQLSRMGDLVQSLPLLQRLKEGSSAREITLVCLREFQAIIQDQPWPDRLIALELADVHKLSDEENRKEFWQLPPFIGMPEFAETYDRVINLTHDEGSAVLCEKIQGHQKSGRIHTLPNEIRLLGDWAKYLFAAVRNRRLNLFNLVDIYLGIGGVPPRAAQPDFKIAAAAEEEARAILNHYGYAGKGRLVGLQMGASDLRRAWPVEKFSALARHLGALPGLEIVLFGNQKEASLGNEFVRRAERQVINLIGQTDLRKLPALLKACDLLISNDTGPIHIAAAVGTQVLGLYFSTAYFAETAPYGEGHVVLQVENEPAVANSPEFSASARSADLLPVEAVHEVALKMLGRVRNWPSRQPGLGLYQSKFLSNGTLIYAPVGEPSRGYLDGVSNRLMWEKAFGVAKDTTFAAELFLRGQVPKEFQDQLADYRHALRGMQSHFSNGFELARQMMASAASETQTSDRAVALEEHMKKTVKEISSLGERFGLLTDFFHYEIMDLDFLPRPALAQELARKFQKLENLSRILLETRAEIEARVRGPQRDESDCGPGRQPDPNAA